MPSFFPPIRRCVRLVWIWCAFATLGAWGQVPATAVPLMMPGGVAYDAAGNLFVAETGGHVVRRVSAAGGLTTFAGTGVQGFGGDGGPAAAALLDSPMAVAVDAAGDVYIADAHNYRIRRVDAVTGTITTAVGTGVAGLSANGTAAVATAIDLPAALAFDASGDLYFADARTHVVRRIDHATTLVTTVAGSGVQGSAGDGGPAVAAAIDTPSGIALDAAGNLYLADAHNHRLRRVDAVTGVISAVAGTGQPGFGGDGGAAVAARIDLPRGLALDAAGNLLFADALNHRVRRIDAVTGVMTTVAGDGVQGFAGDGGLGVAASLDSPRAVTLTAGGLPTLADSGNARVRQVDTAGVITTVAGVGVAGSGAVTLSGPGSTVYGTGSVVAALAASAATGTVTFTEMVGGVAQALGTAVVSGGAASLSLGTLAVGTHTIVAVYGGDGTHVAASSAGFSILVTPAALVATPNAVGVVYGQAIPALTGTLVGVLARDAGAVTLGLTTTAQALASPGSYVIVAAISGAAAGNYAFTQVPAAVTISQAPATAVLTNALAVHVGGGSAGVPTGRVSLLDGGNLYATAALSATGDAVFSAANLSSGTHTLTSVYGGDVDFLGATSAPVMLTIGTSGAADFALVNTGAAAITVVGGTPVAFNFAVMPVNGALSSPIVLAAAGLPVGAAASFSPAYLPPSSAASSFVLTIQTPRTAALRVPTGLVYALFLPLIVWIRRRGDRWRMAIGLVLGAGMIGLSGCGDRVNSGAASAVAPRVYNVTVNATATAASGATLEHSAVVTLTIE